ncbi:hypothetical protein N802_07390 [Knoellia sinensis KCTC 19936]|uniref:Uncharacterized protein n=1 Tax=Knoellia sinensis KCTC 19936 TaxID=1385520 RepID=A0A0A0JEB6_9MICO|nr:hypothetical protein [Knoellia sinensis]KGN33946.1 hypothetical protein N802_07390 [Knoellia sinensis KCTC 19936]
MSHSTSLRRTACTVGAAGVLALSIAAPASALPDPGEPAGAASSQSRPDGSILQNSAPKADSPATKVPGTAALTVDDNAIEVLQVGAGVLAGLALGGAGIAVASRRHRHAAHPA